MINILKYLRLTNMTEEREELTELKLLILWLLSVLCKILEEWFIHVLIAALTTIW